MKLGKIFTKAEPTAPLLYEITEQQPKVIRKPTLIYPATIQEWPADDSYSQGCAEVNWDPVEMLDLERSKEAVV